ncbi:hypothetical protein PANT_9c00300 [Moesziomyces antarcticus T-34]|uniref:Uncharacterized protein n=1 Tax=Pseudozyma antarctica (strain T-34) TaxID=1151754 RepID=M9MEU4_PSEA3|nr:hypothetical protein PANT_9c00300 [Moesziomyces antarcticus T-34]
MSSKTKPSKFKNAVAASQTSSRSSSPASSSTALSIPEQNALQAVHQEQLARVASATLPRLAALHSRRFLGLAREHVKAADAMWTAQKLQPVAYRRSLWAEDIEPTPRDEGETKKRRKDARIVPDFYHRHNPRCTNCALPLVPGINLISTRKTASKQASAARGKLRRKPICTLCNHKQRTS